jgi:putative transport protein
VALGLLIGFFTPIGFAGGTLVVALFFGSIGRTGGMVWNLPFSANIALRQIGLILFLAAIGMGAGSGFKDVFQHGDGLRLFAAGAGITFVSAFVATVVGYRLLKIPMTLLSGMVAGIHTQPAVLSWAAEQTRNEIPNLGYAAVYPTATIAKILLVQLFIRLF